ncbi:hypothetical protein, partial [Salmonella enterica]|uniref:hypothetical protein n=1 Tax=Salmonella enterica TaxID=28901 RepID=UPI0021B4309D
CWFFTHADTAGILARNLSTSHTGTQLFGSTRSMSMAAGEVRRLTLFADEAGRTLWAAHYGTLYAVEVKRVYAAR